MLTQNRLLLGVIGILGLVIAIAYFPVFQMGLVGDDFIYLKLIHFTAKAALPTDNFALWFSDLVKWSLNDLREGFSTIRPVRMLSMWGDYFAFGLNPLGYHLTGLLLHWATAFVVFLIGLELTRDKILGLLAALLFALLPIHSSDIAWIAARYHVIAGLLFALSFFFYLKRRDRKLYFLSVGLFIVGLFANEAMMTLPLALTVYELVYHRPTGKAELWHTGKRLALFWLIVPCYVLLRFALFGQMGGPKYATFSELSLPYKFSGLIQSITDPLLVDITSDQSLALFAIVLVIFLLYCRRRIVLLGGLWVAVTWVVFISLPVEERYFYIPSIGLVLALAGILVNPLPRAPRVSLAVGVTLTVLLVGVYGMALYERNENWRNAGRITERVISEVKRLHPSVPRDSRLVFVNVPLRLRRAFVFLTGIEAAMQLAYDDSTIHAFIAEDFPILTDNLDKTYFFEYDTRNIIERSDLVNKLQERQECSADTPSIVWDFDADAQGWEAWNELEDVEVKDGQLLVKATGTDPFLGSPILQVDPARFGGIRVTMTVQSSESNVEGTVFWQTAGMGDFSPAFASPFQVVSDGTPHEYDIALALDTQSRSPIVRMRLDPSNQPGKIQIDSIAILCKP